MGPLQHYEALVITQPGKFELRAPYVDRHGIPLLRLRYMIRQPLSVYWKESVDPAEAALPINYVTLERHRIRPDDYFMYPEGSYPDYLVYWPQNWPDEWGMREFILWKDGAYPDPEIKIEYHQPESEPIFREITA
jgi:hypothetical protein